MQHTIVTYLLSKLKSAALQTNIKHIAIAGGVAANSGLRNELQLMANNQNWTTYIPAFEYCTDNAAMIAIAGYHKFLVNDFVEIDIGAYASTKK